MMTPNNTHPLLDIIIPVYNTAQYLEQCIQSVIAQTFTNWHMLLVDDGSTDNSPQICDKWAERDPRITVIHKANTGQADSRNVALERSTAELIGFVDSDDWIEPDMYATLINAMRGNNADIALCSHFKDNMSESQAKSIVGVGNGNSAVIEGDNIQRLIIRDRIQSYIWQMVFRRECLAYRMPNHICFEDYAVLPHWFENARRVVCIQRPLYHYRMRKSSAVHEKSPEKEYAFFEAEKQRFEFYRNTPMRDESTRQMVVRCLRVAKYITRMNIQRHAINTYLHSIRQQLANISTSFSRQLNPKDRLLYWLLTHHTRLFIAYQKTEKAVMVNKRSNNKRLYD